MESKLTAAAGTAPSRFGTRNLEIASRLAISRLRVPNLDGFVIAAAGNFFSIGAPRYRVNTVFVRSQYTNQQKPGGKTCGKNLLARVPGHHSRLALTKRNEQKLKENFLALVPPHRALANVQVYIF